MDRYELNFKNPNKIRNILFTICVVRVWIVIGFLGYCYTKVIYTFVKAVWSYTVYIQNMYNKSIFFEVKA